MPTPHWHFSRTKNLEGSPRLSVTATIIAFDSTWHHIVWVDNNGTYVLYVDGVSTGSGTYTKNAKTLNRTTFRARGRTAYDYFFAGNIDNVMLFDKALSADEVQLLYGCDKAAPTYDNAGNLTKDKNGYKYEYDYENRIVKITKDSNDIAEFAYDALARRIRKIDSKAGETTRYYYSKNWQVLTNPKGTCPCCCLPFPWSQMLKHLPDFMGDCPSRCNNASGTIQ